LEDRMNPARRLLLRGALPSATLTLALAAGLLRPGTSWGSTSPLVSQPPETVVTEMLQALRTAQPAQSADIHIVAPKIAENGANVFLEISSTLPQVDGFVVFVDSNPQPLSAAFWIAPEVVPEIRTRIKMAQTGNVWVIVRSRGQFFKAYKTVKVTVGGCGVGLN
jgi:sulfur-oxidizing protein SoxY